MAAPLELVLPFLFLGALLYSSVGHGGATVYLAILTLAGHAIDPLVTTVLVLNIAAAGLGFVRFTHAGHLRPQLLWPFLVTSIPFAYLGGLIVLPAVLRSQVLGVLLLVAALRFLAMPRPPERGALPAPRILLVVAPILGAALGFTAGATGIGGGIFLSPVLVLLGWASVREAAAVSAVFIALNSLAGLAARLPRTALDVPLLVPALIVIVLGALIGSWLGARRLPPRALGVALALVLLVAGAKAIVG